MIFEQAGLYFYLCKHLSIIAKLKSKFAILLVNWPVHSLLFTQSSRDHFLVCIWGKNKVWIEKKMNKNLSQVFYFKMDYFNPEKVLGSKIYQLRVRLQILRPMRVMNEVLWPCFWWGWPRFDPMFPILNFLGGCIIPWGAHHYTPMPYDPFGKGKILFWPP